MAKHPNNNGTRQMSFDGMFAYPSPPSLAAGSLNVGPRLRALLSEMLKITPLTRYQVAARMSELLGQDVTKHQLDSWTAESRNEWRFPFEYAPAFEAACETHDLTEFLAALRGSIVLVGEDALKAELGALEIAEAEIKTRKRKLKRQMGDSR